MQKLSVVYSTLDKETGVDQEGQGLIKSRA